MLARKKYPEMTHLGSEPKTSCQMLLPASNWDPCKISGWHTLQKVQQENT